MFMIRLFAGLSLPDSIRDHLNQIKLGLPQARWVERENLHLTLYFIGMVDEPVVEDIDLYLSTLDFKPFELTISGVNCFHSRNKVRSVWAGVETTTEITALHEKVKILILRAGLLADRRKFVPHVTLARLKKTSLSTIVPYLGQKAGFRLPPFKVSEITLFQSHILSNGTAYEALATYPAPEVTLRTTRQF